MTQGGVVDDELTEIFEYPLTRLDPVRGDHIDPPSPAVYETLLTKGPDDQPRPGLAQSWTVSEDGRSLRLRLRDDARFHSGAPCDARAVVEALELTRWGDGLSRQVWYWDPVDTVAAEGDQTVVFWLRHRWPRLPTLLWGTHTAIAEPTLWRENPDTFGVTISSGTGPYRMVSFDPDEVVAERVAAGSGQPSRITWRSVPDDEARAATVATSDADIVRYVHTFPEDPGARWRMQSQLECSQFYLAFDFRDARGFDDIGFRRSVDAFIDRTEIVANAFGGRGDGRRSPIPAASPFAAAYDEAPPALTREAARRTLAELGWRPGPGGVLARGDDSLVVDCVIQDTAVCRRIATVVQGQLREAGIELRLRPEQLFGDFYRAVQAKPEAFLSKWLWPDAMEAVYGFCRTDCIEGAGGNWQGARTPEVDRVLDQYQRSTDDAARWSATGSFQEAFMTHLPFIPLVSPTEDIAVAAHVSGFGLTPGTLYPAYDDVVVSRGGTS